MAGQSRLKKASYNVVILAIYQIVLFACNLILPRYILTSFGSEYNGIVSSITQFLSFVSILRLGVAGATRVELYKSLATNDVEKTSSIVRATEIYLRKVAGIFVGFVIILMIVYPLLIDSSYGWPEISSLVFIISIGTFAQYFFGLTYSTLLQADQRLYIYNVIQIVATILNTLIACFLMYLGMSIQVVKFGSATIYTITPIILSIYVRKKYHLNKNAKPDNIALKRKNDVFAHSIANIVHDNTDVIVLTLLTDVKVVSVYAVYNLVMNGLKQLMSIFTSGLESAFGDMFVKKEEDNLYKNLNLYEFFVSAFVMIVFSCAYTLILPFVAIYTSGVTDTIYIVPVYAIIALLAQAMYCLRMPYLTVVHAAGHYKETKWVAITEAVINITVSVIFVFQFDLIGVAIGTLAANCFRTIQYAWYVSKHLITRKSFGSGMMRLLWLSITSLVGIFIFNSLLNIIKIEINDWVTWSITGIICIIFYSSVCIISSLLFYKNDLKQSIMIIKRVIKK